ncbi:MAG: hypothetical protein K2X86_09000, partial [Cytophagaceae bacterium]|nr:hypothetical protein [Cytophagaceae bacterium]
MKKKKLNLFFVSLLIISAIGSSYIFKVEKEELPKKVGVISVYAVKNFSEYGFPQTQNLGQGTQINEAPGFYSKVRNRAILNHTFNLDKVKARVFEQAGKFPFEMISEDKILKSPEYKKLIDRPGYNGIQNIYSSATGYHPIVYSDKFTIKDAFKVDQGMDGAMIVQLKYTLNNEYKNLDTGMVSVTADIYLQVSNKDGKKSYKLNCSGKSND